VPLHSDGSSSIVSCVFVSAGICLPSRCLAMNAYSDFNIPVETLVSVLFVVLHHVASNGSTMGELERI
jgi:hypothetical protein